MRIAIFFILCTFLSSCSKSPSTNNQDEFKDAIIELSPITFNYLNESSLNTVLSMDFGVLPYGAKVTQDLIFVNKSTSSLVISEEDMDLSMIEQPFELKSNGCVGQTLQKNRSCKITIQLNSFNEFENQKRVSFSFRVKGLSVDVEGVLEVKPDEVMPEGMIVTGDLTFDGFTGESDERTILISNKTGMTQSFTLPLITEPNFSLTTTCPSSILRNRSCSIKVKYQSVTDVELDNQPLFTLFGTPLTYIAYYYTRTYDQIVDITAVSSSTAPYFNAKIRNPGVFKGSFNFINKSNRTMPGPISIVIQDFSAPVGIIIDSISCASGLSINRVCKIDFSINISNLEQNMWYGAYLTLQSGIIHSMPASINIMFEPIVIP